MDATIDRRAAAGERWDAIIVGAGPAGASAAVTLAEGGRRVLLVDRRGMPRPKVCGCCLSAVATDELTAIGCAPERLGGIPRTHVRLVADTGEIVLPLSGWTLSRESLDAAIVRRAIAVGAAWLPSTPVSSVAETEGGVAVVARSEGGGEFPLFARLAAVANGLGGGLRILSDGKAAPRSRPHAASRLGIGGTLPAEAATAATGELLMRVGDHGYCGIVRLEDGRIDVAAAIDAAAVGRREPAASAVAKLFGDRSGTTIDVGRVATPFLGTPPLTHSCHVVAGNWRRIHRVGDAASYVEPFTGEGIGWALVSGRSFAEAVLSQPAANDTATAFRIASAHERSVARRIAAPRRRCRRVAAAVRSPCLVSAAVATARLLPAAAAWAMPFVVGWKNERRGCPR